MVHRKYGSFQNMTDFVETGRLNNEVINERKEQSRHTGEALGHEARGLKRKASAQQRRRKNKNYSRNVQNR